MIKFPTDFHIGKNLQANTTFNSRKALKQKLFDSAMEVLEYDGDFNMFCGDLFNSYNNEEVTLMQGYEICQKLDWILAGNHDLTNREDAIGSLQVLEEILDEGEDGTFIRADMGETHSYEIMCGEGVELFMVPHHSSQELFEEALQSVIEQANNSTCAKKLLCLHCNYEMPWDHNETTLNLTNEDGEVLLDSFDYVLIGHEHNSNTYHDGRLIMLGNHHPTGFADIADKYLWSFEGGKMKKERIWRKDEHYLELKPFEELPDYLMWGEEAQFIRIVGELPSEDYPAFVKWMVGLWKKFPNAFAIKNSAEILRTEVDNKIDEEELESLPDTILKELKDSPMKPIYEELLESIS